MSCTSYDIPSVKVVDVRSTVDFEHRHLRGALHIPLDQWRDRTMELPPRGHKWLLVTAGAPLLDAAVTSAGGSGLKAILTDDIVKHFRDDITDVWTVTGDKFWETVDASLIETGAQDKTPILWSPSPFADETVSAIRSFITMHGSTSRSNLRILDAGCGTGRNAIYIARKLLENGVNDFSIVAVDNRTSIIERCEKFVARMGLQEYITCRTCEIEHILEGGDPFDVALYFRFTLKSAIRNTHKIIRRDAGGLLIVESFHMDATHPTDAIAKLSEGELLELVTGVGDFSVAQGIEKTYLAEDGRPMIASIVRYDAK